MAQPRPPDTVKIDDSTENVTVTSDNPSALGPVIIVGERVSFTYTEPIPVRIGQDGIFYRNILEADGTLSDRITFTLTLGDPVIQVLFESDPDIVPTPPPGGIPFDDITESGDFQTVAQYFDLSTGDLLTTYQVRSDVEPVPETGNLVVVGLAFASLLVFARLNSGRHNRSASS
jgi:hypothetical protein